MSAPTILIAGLGRCGSSLMMQMLYAAGVSTIGHWPAFEDDLEVAMRSDADAWHKLTAGKAVKILNPHVTPPPAAGDYRTIFLTRSIEEQAKSTYKFIGSHPSRADRRAMQTRLQGETRQARKALTQLGTGMYFSIPFEELITRPRETAADIASYLSMRRPEPLDAAAMAACVRERAPACLPYLLETELIHAPPPRTRRLVANNAHGEQVR